MGVAMEVEEARLLEPVERKLVEHVERGELLDLAGDAPVDEAAMRSWGHSRTISAVVVRDIVRGRLAAEPDPRGLRLRGARISGRVDLENVNSSICVELTDCLLDQGLVVRDATLARLALVGSRLEHRTDPALNAERFTTGLLDLRRVSATAHNADGTVILVGARVEYLMGSDAKLRNDSGPAVNADHLRVDHRVQLRGNFEAVGAGGLGTIRLVGAHLGRLECDGARVRNDSGPALHAVHLRVDGSTFLRDGFEAIGAGELGTIRLSGAHLGHLDCDAARVRNDSGPALHAERLQVDRNAFFRHGFEAVGAGNDVVLNLVGVRIGGFLEFDATKLEHGSDPHARIAMNGLVYAGLPVGVSADDWLDLVRDGTPGYEAQPYQQLAAAHRAAGHDGQARRVLRIQRRDQITRWALSGRGERAWARFTGLTLGYGYQPWRALVGLLAVVVAGAVLAILLGGQGGLAHVRNTSSPSPTACGMVERVGVGLDVGTPLITTGARATCEATSTPTGYLLTVCGWALRLLAWAFATLFIAGFTGAVRKT